MTAVTTLSDELDKMRQNICHDCKKKLLPGSFSVATGLIAASSTLASAPLSQPPIENAGSGGTSNSSLIPKVQTNNTSGMTHQTTVVTPANSAHEQTHSSSDPKSELPEFSVVYNPAVNRALHLHLAHVFIREYPAFCVKMSPDGQRIAVGQIDSGKTVIHDVKTRSNVRSVSGYLVRNLD